MRLPWVKGPESSPTAVSLSLEERVQRLEFRADQLQADWDEVLEKITKRVARQAAEAKKKLVAELDAPAGLPVDPGANDTVQPAGPIPVDDYGRVSKRFLMKKAMEIKRA
jgi:hypothetical protein